uniref:ADP-dependent glucokinase 2 n=1 Tax=Scleropages formosus TaxID=113540 RepID=A0A8C9SB26_SCLFO
MADSFPLQLKFGTVLSALLAFLRLEPVLSSLLRAEGKVKVGSEGSARPRVAVGFGGRVDIVVDAVVPLDGMDVRPSEEPLHHDFIENAEQLARSFAYFFPSGAASERFVTNDTLFGQPVEASRELPGNRRSVGGDAPVMAGRMAMEGCDVLLGVSANPDFADVLSQHITVAGNSAEEPDIHLIPEYPSGAEWGRYTSERRSPAESHGYIVHSDNRNPYLASMKEFEQKLQEFQPDLLVIGGLQMMDSFPFKQGERDALLAQLSHLLSSTSPKTGVHFEMASFVDEGLLARLLEAVVTHADSLGVNEQELPPVATALDQMRELYRLVNGRRARPLARLHVHTLAFQAIAVARGSPWKNTVSAAAEASLTASRHARGSAEIDPGKAELVTDESFSVSRQEGSRRIPLLEDWEEGDYEICVAPVLVCTEVYQAAGGGDNISAAGLVPQV